MKRNILIIILMLCFMAQGQNQPTIFQYGNRFSNYYYGDTNWVDYKVSTYYNNSWDNYYFDLGSLMPLMGTRGFFGRPCITDVPLKIVGIVSAVIIDSITPCATSSRVPEYYSLYQIEDDSLYFRREVRWDTSTFRQQVSIPFYMSGTYYDPIATLYEAYFEKPVIVHDTFVVGGTTNNNLFHGYSPDIDFPGTGAENYLTRYVVARKQYGQNTFLHPQNPPYYYFRYLWPSMFCNGGTENLDTTSFQKVYPVGTTENGVPEYWLPIFAIFDTMFEYEACMGVTTTGLQAADADTSGSVTLGWNDNGVEAWQVEVKQVEMDSGMLFSTPINYLQVTGLDTGVWYVARVKTLCDSDLFGMWSDTVLFFVPSQPCDVPGWLHTAVLDSATVTLAWNAAAVLSWEVEMNPVDLGMMNAQTMTTTTNSLQVDGLFTNCWYWARVRALCDTDYWSEWTDTIHFYVPNQHPTGPDDTTNTINLVEQYTYLMPNPAREEVAVMSSFRIKSAELYGSDGKLLKEQEVNGVGTRLNLKGLPDGVYFVRVRTSAGITTKRLVIQP